MYITPQTFIEAIYATKLLEHSLQQLPAEAAYVVTWWILSRVIVPITTFGNLQERDVHNNENGTLLKMGRYYNTTMRHYWDMLVK